MDHDPVVVINSIALLRDRGNLDKVSADYQVGKGKCLREGNDLTIVSYGPCLSLCEQAMSALKVDGDLIDLRWIQPWDDGLVLDSLKKTSRLMVVHDGAEIGGLGAEIVARIVKSGFWHLDAPPVRIGASFSPIPVNSRDWTSILPNLASIQSGILEVLGK
jgi:pyruvate/2-oxoglutarate/acetoin dehydrogenase E1 component